MSKLFAFVAAAALSFFVNVQAVHAKTAVLCTGIFGAALAPMTDYEAPLKKKGYQVVRATWLYFPPVKPDVVISHSACADKAAWVYPQARHFPLDGTFVGLFLGCPTGTRCENYYAPIDKVPLLVCCGGYPLPRSAVKTKVPGTPSFIFAPGHLRLPTEVRDRVLARVP